MKIKKRDLIFVISDISESLYRITTLTDGKEEYEKKEINKIYEEVLIISGYINSIKKELIKLSNNL